VNDDPLEWKIRTLRGQLLDLGSAIRQLNQSGLDSATAQLLMSRKRAELEDLMKKGRLSRSPREVRECIKTCSGPVHVEHLAAATSHKGCTACRVHSLAAPGACQHPTARFSVWSNLRHARKSVVSRFEVTQHDTIGYRSA
jgi:hypothetical protein